MFLAGARDGAGMRQVEQAIRLEIVLSWCTSGQPFARRARRRAAVLTETRSRLEGNVRGRQTFHGAKSLTTSIRGMPVRRRGAARPAESPSAAAKPAPWPGTGHWARRTLGAGGHRKEGSARAPELPGPCNSLLTVRGNCTSKNGRAHTELTSLSIAASEAIVFCLFLTHPRLPANS